ncbi:MAG: hypothetical protein FJ010_11815 [Chloroflexi bacterium]|nr:hypothetical protein [Chloroflexota bacterium]
MTEEPFDYYEPPFDESPPPEMASNRTFLLVAGILGAILILSLILMAVYAMVVVPKRRSAQSTQVAQINAQNTQVAIASGLTAEAQSWTATPTATRTQPPIPPTSSPTPVVAPTNTPAAGIAQDRDAQLTATMAALFTQQAANLLTVTPVSTQLPSTGFVDDFGIPGLFALAGAMILVIFLARRLRTTG